MTRGEFSSTGRHRGIASIDTDNLLYIVYIILPNLKLQKDQPEKSCVKIYHNNNKNCVIETYSSMCCNFDGDTTRTLKSMLEGSYLCSSSRFQSVFFLAVGRQF